ncbi:MAG: hypothetical protein R3C28_00415 [Pirellulaceae bacterium]
MIVFVAVSFAIGLALSLTKLWGLKLVRTWDANGETSQKSVRWNMRTSASFAVLLLMGSLLVWFHLSGFPSLNHSAVGQKMACASTCLQGVAIVRHYANRRRRLCLDCRID